MNYIALIPVGLVGGVGMLGAGASISYAYGNEHYIYKGIGSTIGTTGLIVCVTSPFILSALAYKG
jgi:hypothetical protein